MSLERELAGVLPAGAISVVPADLVAVSMDLWPRHVLGLQKKRLPALPAAVVWPESAEEVVRLFAWARRTGTRLVPYGAGSSVVGGASPEPGAVVVDTKRLQKIGPVDVEGRMVSAEAGVLGEVFERTLNKHGLTQGHFPSSIYCTTVGGWIAARGAGQMSSRYGKIEDLVLGGLCVLADGTVLRARPTPHRAVRLDELVGNEGTTGLWLEATLRVHPLPRRRAWRGLSFPSIARALDAARAWLAAGLSPQVVRIYDPVDTLLHKSTHGDETPHDRGPSRMAWLGANFPRLVAAAASVVAKSCRTVVGLQGEPEAVDHELEVLLEIARSFGAHDLGPAPGEAWYARRYAVSYRQSNAFRAGVMADTMEVACPWSRVVPVYEAVRRAALGAGAQVLAHFSHLYLDGASIYFTYGMPARLGERGYFGLWEAVLAAAVTNGGNVSHHHGAGKLKAAANAASLGPAAKVLAALKLEADPAGVMNPGVLLQGNGGALPHTPAAAPAQGDGLLVAASDETLGAASARAKALGQSLGPMPRLFPELTVRQAAQRGLLWRANPQLRVLEPLWVSAEGRLAGEEFAQAPAARSALGPDLFLRLLEAGAERVVLRCLPALTSEVVVGGPREVLLARAIELLRHESDGGALLSLRGSGDQAVLAAAYIGGELGEARHGRLGKLLADTSPPALELYGPLGPEPIAFSAPWRAVREVVSAAALARLGWMLVLTDPVGASGFVFGAPGVVWDEATRARFVDLLREVGAVEHLERRAAPQVEPAAAPVAPEVPAESPPPAEPARRLALLPHAHELDNCTYCPKLCRFSCPTAAASGNEALVPRQLMLTASLERKGGRALDESAADRLYSCVDCKGCKSFCDHGNDVAATLMDARAELFAAGRTPPQPAAVLRHFREHGFLPGIDPLAHPGRTLAGDGPSAQAWLFLGCQNQSERDQPIAVAALELARRSAGSVHVADAVCCGQPLWRWGDRQGFREHAARVAETLSGASRLFVDDPGCAWTLGTLYRQVGVVAPEVVWLPSLVAEPAVRPDDVPHDPCQALRYLGAPSARRFFPASPPGSIMEGQGGCCGGLLLEHYDPALADRVARDLGRDLVAAGAKRIVTSSPTCRRRLRAAGFEVTDLTLTAKP